VKALRISPQGDVTEVHLPDDHGGRFVEALRTLIAATTIEALALTTRWDAWLDEDGYANAQPLNTHAIALASQYGIPAPLRGTVVITGADRETGCAAALTSGQVTAIRQLVMNPSKTSP
jgi:hypothetical protein